MAAADSSRALLNVSQSDPKNPPSLSAPTSTIVLDLRHTDIAWSPSIAAQLGPDVISHFTAFELELDTSSHDEASKVETPQHLAANFLKYLSRHDSPQLLIRALLNEFEREFLARDDIHTASLSLPDASSQIDFLSGYFAAVGAAGAGHGTRQSKLLARARDGQETLFGVFGGQGSSNLTSLKELRQLYNIYGSFLDELLVVATEELGSLASQDHTSNYFEDSGFDVRQWISEVTTGPREDQIHEAPFSFPLIGLLSLAHFCVTCKVLGQTPGEIRDAFTGMTGHSQGIVTAALVARSTDWSSFYESVRMSMRILFCIGFECHQKSLLFSSIPAHAAQDCVDAGEGTPSPMLSVRGLDQPIMQAVLKKTNSYLGKEECVHVALINSPRSMVIAGPPRSLCALSARLRKMKATDGLDQSKVVFNKRKPVIRHQFLPMSSAFHSPLSSAATQAILGQLKTTSIYGKELGVSVYHTLTRLDLRNLQEHDIIPDLVTMITTDVVNWPRVAAFPANSTIVDFGPGGPSRMLQDQINGAGIRVISASDLTTSKMVGSKASLFTLHELARVPQWQETFRPHVVTNATGVTTIENKMTRLFGCPPIMVAGMTPTTVPYDFVARIMEAGYHAELACGGYNSQALLESAIIKLSKEIPSTAGITCNIIYASPKVVGWQIPLLRDLIRRGYPIQGLTVGAGIPSAEVVTEYITTMGLRHISFKPGSVGSIKEVVRIAKQHPDFPIGLQWTGGRAGGHHSYEDFHAAMLETYSDIRQCDNIVLIAGSGFGGSEDTYPYLSGGWSLKLGYPAMPYDGVLLGSRVMVAKEAHTSPEAKALIVQASGVADGKWHETYTRPTGGIITVRSEMGQPIHKIATRGVMLWSELDQKFFNISDRAKRLAELRTNRNWIIHRLNKDFQKVWFAMDSRDSVVEVEDMTYAEVLTRLVSLMYLRHQQRWIDASYKSFVADFYQRARERLQDGDRYIASEDLQDPERELIGFLSAFPEARHETLHPDDVDYFLSLCRQRGRKPVNFIPAIDEDFETWFKKDSLWQAEDVDSLPDQDAQRACIIHGPVAASFSLVQDEPVKDILDSIRTSWINKIQENETQRSPEEITKAQSANVASVSSSSDIYLLVTEDTAARKRYEFPMTGDLPEASPFREHLCKNLSGWALDCIREQTVRQGSHNRPNPLRSVLVPTHGHDLVVENTPDGQTAALVMYQRISRGSRGAEVIRVEVDENKDGVSVTLLAPSRDASTQVPIYFHFTHAQNATLVKFQEDMTGRNKRIKDFYSRLWLPKDETLAQNDTHQRFSGVQTTLTSAMVQNFAQAVGSNSFRDGLQTVPIDISIVVAWEPLVKPLLDDSIDCDILQLLHRSNEFAYVEGAKPLQIGDVLDSSSQVQSVSIHNGNKIVEVLAEITRNGKPVVHVRSKFFCKGTFNDVESIMTRVIEPKYEVAVKSEVEAAVLTSRQWLEFEEDIIVGQKLSFDISTETTHDKKSGCDCLKVTGTISLQTTEGVRQVGRVNFEGLVRARNPVIEFLERHGSLNHKVVALENAGMDGESTWNTQALRTNSAYSRASKDTNPIHTLPVFARYAHLDGVVNHGMGTSAIVLRSLEKEVAEGDFSRIKRWLASFEGMVLPGDELKINIQHTGMKDGLMVMAVKASNASTGETVLEAEADVEQQKTAYIFTGQGSQEKGMGMKLYETSEAARGLWDRADKKLYEMYGFSILDIVRNDPKTITIHFKGARGRQIRDNYLALTMDHTRENGEVVREPLLKELTPTSQSYTFADARGLLYSTQFAQPAITLMEMATAVDLEAKGLVQEGASYAGHSLGEYSALGAIARVMPMESMVNLVFYRGLAMQTAMERDENGRTEFSMMAVNPSRVAAVFGQAALENLVGLITKHMGILLEIVNFNVDGRQYVCAGHLRALWTLSQVLDTLAATKMKQVPANAELFELVKEKAEASLDVPEPVELERGAATVPLRGIDVPFHSRYLRHGIPAYRRYLETQILEENIDVDRLASFVPNVTAKPFSTDKAYVEEAAELMNSDGLRALLAEWTE